MRGLLGLGDRLGLGDIGRGSTPLGWLELGRNWNFNRSHFRGDGLGGAPFRLLGLFGGLLPLLPFPAETDRGHLGVVERLQRAAGNDMHVLEQCHQLLGRNPEFTG